MQNLSLENYIQDSFFPISVEIMTRQNNVTDDIVPLHSHDFSEIVLIADGTVTHCCNHETAYLKKGDFFLIHPGMEHSYSDITQDTRVFNILFNSRVPVPMILLTKSPFIQLLYPEKSRKSVFHGILGNVADCDLDKIIFLLQTIHSESKHCRDGHQAMILSLFTASIVFLASHYNEASSDITGKWTLNKSIQIMNDQCSSSQFTIQNLAQRSGMSIRALQRNFKESLGMRPTEYLQRLRTARAIALLLKTSLTNDSIAAQCGFFNYSHMWRVFQKLLHCSPSAVRNRTVSGDELEMFRNGQKQYNIL